MTNIRPVAALLLGGMLAASPALAQSKGQIERLQSLAAAAPDRADELQGQRDRLVEPKAMGDLFKAMAFTAPHWPTPAGFEGDAA